MKDYICLENCLQLFKLSSKCNIKCIAGSAAIYIGSNFSQLIKTQYWKEASSDFSSSFFMSLMKHDIVRNLPLSLLMRGFERYECLESYLFFIRTATSNHYTREEELKFIDEHLKMLKKALH